MGNKDWSHLQNEHQSRFSKGQPKEAPLEKGSPENLEDTLTKEVFFSSTAKLGMRDMAF